MKQCFHQIHCTSSNLVNYSECKFDMLAQKSVKRAQGRQPDIGMELSMSKDQRTPDKLPNMRPWLESAYAFFTTQRERWNILKLDNATVFSYFIDRTTSNVHACKLCVIGTVIENGYKSLQH